MNKLLIVKKIPIAMRITCLLLCLIVFQLQAEDVYSQKTKISLDMKNTTIEKVLQTIEEKSDYHFLYNNKLVNVDRKVSVRVKNAAIADVLNKLFASEDVEYQVEGNQIILSPKEKVMEIVSGVEFAQQQQKTITGKVTDTSGQPLPGATVVVKGTTIGTVSDADGNYSLSNVPPDATLVFSFVGMETQEINVANRTRIDVTLQEEAIALEEVVAVGYGVQRKVNLTGAVSSINIEKLENRPITSTSQALQGVPGLYVNQPGGQPGKDQATIRIRGQGTLNTNDPLVLVDGVQFSLDAINPNDIESISILKDAASAAIYGNRAANGVVLVTTKKGRKGISQVEYNNYIGFQTPTYLPDVVKDPVEFMELRDQAQRNAGKPIVDFGEAIIEEYRQGMLVDPYIYPANDWLDIMFNNALIQEHNLRFFGGNEKINYVLSLSYLDQNGVLMGTNSDKFSFRSNVNFQLNDKIRIGSDILATYYYIHEPATTAATMMEMVFKAQGYHPTYLKDGRYADTWVRTPGHNVFRHPLVWANEGFLKNKNLRDLASIYIDAELLYGFSYHAKAAVNKLDGFQKRFVPDIYMYQNKTLEPRRVDYYTDNKNRHVRDRDDEDLNITLYHTLNWENTFKENHNLSALIGSSYEQFFSRFFTATSEGYLGNNLYEINAGSTNPAVSGTSFKNVLIGTFGRVNYNYQQKYLFEVNFRYDGSSRFAEGNRWGFFPSFSAGWRLDQEKFLTDIDWLSGLKLRLSYGSLGNEGIGNFRYVNLIDAGKEYLFGGIVNPGTAITSYNDPNITWETTTMANIGVDASLFASKLNITFELYDKRTKDILRTVPLPAQVGNLGGPIMNIGTISNKGFELDLGFANNIGKSFNYELNFGVNHNVNNVESLRGDEIVATGSPGYYIPTIIKEGYPIDSYYVLECEGIFQSWEEIENHAFQNITTKPGYLKYKDQNNDNVVNSDDRIITGKALPDYTYNFSINFSYKNWSLSSLFNGVKGVDTYPQRIIATPFWFGTSVTKNWVKNSWRPDKPNASLPILTTYEESVNDNFLYSDFWLLDASYLRLKNLQLSYSFSDQILEKIGLRKLILFINGQNIFTISKMKDFDPERHIKQADYYEYPSVKTFSGGINVTF
jgi:TonB-linked SusC/RagA family outer membrane protein